MSKKSFDKDFFETLYKSEDQSFWFRSRNKIIIWLLNKYYAGFENFIEIGCGTGYVLNGIKKEFPKAKYTGSEYFMEGIKFAEMRMPDVNFIQLDAKNMNENRVYDVVGIFDVLEHIDDDELVLRNIHNSLSDDGMVLITVPQHMCLWSNADVQACHERRYTQNELKNKMKAAGFEINYISGFVSLLFPLMWLSRKNTKSDEGIETELEMNKYLNKLLLVVMNIERVLLKLGVKFKFGGSIIAIGRKI